MDVIKRMRQHNIWVYVGIHDVSFKLLKMFFKYFTAAKNIKERWLPWLFVVSFIQLLQYSWR